MRQSTDESTSPEIGARSSAPAPSDASLAATVGAALRASVQAYVRGEATDEAMRQAIAIMCARARGSGAPPEQLLVLVKQTWSTLPDVRSIAASTARQQLLEGFIQACIREYYADEPKPGADNR